jgi:hypothetical protein
MKPQPFIRLSICLFLLLAATHFTSSAQKKVSFNTSSVVPGAQGTVKVKKDKNGNYVIDIHIENLAPPGQLTPAKKLYVAWVETEEKGARNIGQLKTSSSMFSKTRKGSIETVSPYKPVKVFISAEDDAGIEQPGMVIVLTTDYYK